MLVKNVNPEYGYLDRYTHKWRGDSIYINEVIKYDSPKASVKEKEFKLARFDMYAGMTWGLSYMRHTGKWSMIPCGESFEDCFDMFKDHPIFNR